VLKECGFPAARRAHDGKIARRFRLKPCEHIARTLLVTIAGDADGILRDGAENRWVNAEIDGNRFQLQCSAWLKQRALLQASPGQIPAPALFVTARPVSTRIARWSRRRHNWVHPPSLVSHAA
jgi:hypothetical protein